MITKKVALISSIQGSESGREVEMGIAEPTLSDTAGNPGIELSELFSAAY